MELILVVFLKTLLCKIQYEMIMIIIDYKIAH